MQEAERPLKGMFRTRKGRALVRRQSRLCKLLVGEVEHAASLTGRCETDEEDDGRNRISRESRALRVLCYRVRKHMRQVEQNWYRGELLASGHCRMKRVLRVKLTSVHASVRIPVRPTCEIAMSTY
jgi:hypothetical protein